MYREKGARIRKEWESKPAQQFSNRSKSRCLILSPGQDYLESDIYETCPWGSTWSAHPTGKFSSHPSHGAIPKRGQESGTGPCPALADAQAWVLFAIRTGEQTWAERRYPNTEMPRMERECPRKSPAPPADAMGTLCSVLKVRDFAANVKVSCEQGQKSETRLLGLTFSSIKLLHLQVPTVLPKNIQKCPQK